MDTGAMQDSALFAWVLLPALIFCARIFDVSIGTVRVIFIARGYRLYAPILGFFEVLIWLIAIGQIMKNLNNVACYLAYASGYATGTYVGIWLEGKLSLGQVIVRVITRLDASELVKALRRQDYMITTVNTEGAMGPVKLIFSVLQRQSLKEYIGIIRHYNPRAFYSVEDVRFVSEGGEMMSKPAVMESAPVTGEAR